jgi:F0F1-type ATP synthase delta subunit
VAGRFIDRLGEVEADEASAIARAARANGGTVTIDSAHDLPAAVKARVTRAVHKLLGDDLEVTYRRDAALLLGLRLRGGGRTLEWSLSSYLDRLEEAARDKLAEFEPVADRAAA